MPPFFSTQYIPVFSMIQNKQLLFSYKHYSVDLCSGENVCFIFRVEISVVHWLVVCISRKSAGDGTASAPASRALS
jgi:hypothetical protein